MKKIMCVISGLLVLSPALVMAQDQMSAIKKQGPVRFEQKAPYQPIHGESAHRMEKQVLKGDLNHIFLGKFLLENQVFASAFTVVMHEMKEKQTVSFEALDLLGMSFNTLKNPMNIKTAGEYHKKLEKQYVTAALAALDTEFVSLTEVSLAEIAMEAKPTLMKNAKLTNQAIFEQLDGHFAERLAAEQQAEQEEAAE